VDHVLTTERLVLRPVTAQDHAALLAHWTAPEVRRFLFDGEMLSSAEVTEAIDDSARDFATAGYGLWLIQEKDRIDLVGSAGLRPLEDLGLEIFYSLAPGSWGDGYATRCTPRSTKPSAIRLRQPRTRSLRAFPARPQTRGHHSQRLNRASSSDWTGTSSSEESEDETAGHDTLPDIAPEPEAKVTADLKIVGDIVASNPHRDHNLRAPRPERPVVLAVDQSAEDLIAMGLAVLGTQHHTVRPGTKLRAGIVVAARVRRNQSLELVPLHIRHRRSLEHT